MTGVDAPEAGADGPAVPDGIGAVCPRFPLPLKTGLGAGAVVPGFVVGKPPGTEGAGAGVEGPGFVVGRPPGAEGAGACVVGLGFVVEGGTVW